MKNRLLPVLAAIYVVVPAGIGALIGGFYGHGLAGMFIGAGIGVAFILVGYAAHRRSPKL